MKLKPWHKVEGFAPRENIREGRGLDAAVTRNAFLNVPT